MATGKVGAEVIKETAGELVWGNDKTTVYYTTLDDEHRPNKVWRHR
jgi:oligopeptidase B